MKDQLLFTKTYKSRRSNGSNKAYWTKFIKKLESLEGEVFLSNRYVDTYDDQMPIFNYLSLNKKRGVVIYQYKPNILCKEDTSYTRYITAWTSQRTINGKRVSILTISMIPSKNNMQISKELIRIWMLKRKGIKRLIEKIYELQTKNEEQW